jgi:hypothetical protein
VESASIKGTDKGSSGPSSRKGSSDESKLTIQEISDGAAGKKKATPTMMGAEEAKIGPHMPINGGEECYALMVRHGERSDYSLSVTSKPHYFFEDPPLSDKGI